MTDGEPEIGAERSNQVGEGPNDDGGVALSLLEARPIDFGQPVGQALDESDVVAVAGGCYGIDVDAVALLRDEGHRSSLS